MTVLQSTFFVIRPAHRNVEANQRWKCFPVDRIPLIVQ